MGWFFSFGAFKKIWHTPLPPYEKRTMWIWFAVYALLVLMIVRAVLVESRYSTTVTVKRIDFHSARGFSQLLRIENIPYQFLLPELQTRLQHSIRHHLFATFYASHEVQLFDPRSPGGRLDTYANMTRWLQSAVEGANQFASYNNRLLLPSVSGLAAEVERITFGMFAPLQCQSSSVDFWFGVPTSIFPRTIHFHSRRFLTCPTHPWRLHLCSWTKYQHLSARSNETTLVRCQEEWILNRNTTLHDRLPMTPFYIPVGAIVYIPAGYWFQVELLPSGESTIATMVVMDYSTNWNRFLNGVTEWMVWAEQATV